MQSPLQIHYHGIETSDALSAVIQEEVDALERVFNRITDCTVFVELPHRRHTKGNSYRIGIEVNVPGKRLFHSHESGNNTANHQPDAYILVRDAFEALTRQLQEYKRRVRGEVKTHESPVTHGRVSRLFPQDGYGFILSEDGRDIYFHENALLGKTIEQIDVGTNVRYFEELGQEGPQASTVHC